MSKITTRKIGVVLVSWKIPEQRLQAHFSWNALLYGETGATVFVVTDREYDLPRCAKCVVFPEDRLQRHRGKRMFSLTRTKNAGIKAAIQAGCDPIICTDVDVAFEPDAWERGLAVSTADVPTAFLPVCRMSWSSDWGKRRDKYVLAEGATGIIVMTAADWGRVSFCEEQWGYGGDDGVVLQRIVDAGIHIDRAGVTYHMAHIDGTPQKEFNAANPRTDHWNRENGLNPDNMAMNNQVGRRRLGE